MVSLLVPEFDEIIITEGSFKPTAAEELSKAIDKDVKIIKDSKEAVKEAINSANKEDFVLITGSLYLVGDILHKFNK